MLETDVVKLSANLRSLSDSSPQFNEVAKAVFKLTLRRVVAYLGALSSLTVAPISSLDEVVTVVACPDSSTVNL
jgi:hypothetical protein